MSDKTYLAVPFAEKDQAKALGAWFDRDTKTWFVPPGVDVTPFGAWRPDPTAPLAGHDSTDPRALFADQLRNAGFVLGSQDPIMDGQIHHCPVDGGAKGERSGSYKAYADGVPNGWFQNFKVHEKPVKWVMRTQVPEAVRPTVRALSAQSRQDAPSARKEVQDQAATGLEEVARRLL